MTITDVLKDLLELIEASSGVAVTFANIATLSDDDSIIVNKSAIVFSIVNIEEDKTLKNQSLYKPRVPETSTTVDRYKKPAQNLVFSLLFAAYNRDNTMYSDSIDKLEQILRYLQNNNVFYYNNTMGLKEQDLVTEAEKQVSHKIILDMISLKNDQVNQMWSYLGTKYMPSFLYTLRMIHIQKEDLIDQTIVQELKIELWNNDKNDPTGELETKSQQFKLNQ